MSEESAPAATQATSNNPLQINPELLAKLRADLLQASYTVDTLNSLLSASAAQAIKREIAAAAVREYAQLWEEKQLPAALLANVFTLWQNVSEVAINQALPTLQLAGALELGILRPITAQEVAKGAGNTENGAKASLDKSAEKQFQAAVDLRPYESSDDSGEFLWFIASDLTELATGAPLQAEHVLGIGGATATLINITPRVKGNTALDLGTGCGIQALHAARHIKHVIATDVSARALNFTCFNLELNRQTLPESHEIETRLGSLLEPVAGESFDLIISNPPFVITPRTLPNGEKSQKWTYRDGGKPGDQIVEELLRQAPAHLNPGGYLAMLANWEIQESEPNLTSKPNSSTESGTAKETGQDWQRRLESWLKDIPVNTVIIQREVEDPIAYATTWLRDGGVIERDPQFSPLLHAWLDDFASRKVSGIGFGHVLMHKPLADAPRAQNFAAISSTGAGALGPHYLQLLQQQANLSQLTDSQFKALKLQLAPDVVERRHYQPGSEDPMLIELVQGAFLGRTFQLDTHAAGIIGLLAGEYDLHTLFEAYFSYLENAGIEVSQIESDRMEIDRAAVEANLLSTLRELTLWGLINPQVP